MLNNKRGFSLTVLVIAIAVIIIITATAAISIKNITKDRSISEFMNDLAEVKQYAIEYFNKDGTLPIIDETNVEDNLLQILSVSGDLYQIDENDVGEYYNVDIAKLGKIHLIDENRGYVINAGTLNIYVTTPTEYNGKKYYTLTSDLLGKTNAIDVSVPFEVTIMGNPVTWENKAELLVYIPNEKISESDDWNFRWLKGSHSLDDFKTASTVNYFTYGETITLTENGTYTINVEDPNGKGIVRKVVVTKIDDIPPTIEKVNGKIVIDDAETGVKSIRYKIKETPNFSISADARNEHPEYYTSEDEDANDTDEVRLNKYLGTNNRKGDKLENYLNDYNDYYTQFLKYDKILANEESSTDEVSNAKEAIKVLNNNYPQFAYANRPFSNTEKNIVLYVEDMAGNASVYSAITRSEITALQYISHDEDTMLDAKVTINNNNTYATDPEVSLYLQAKHAKYYYASEEEDPSGTYNFFYNNTVEYKLSDGDGEKTVYVIFEDEAGKKLPAVSDTIFLDTTHPSDTAPTVTGTIANLTITCRQTDTKVVGGKETQSGLNGVVTYGIKESTSTADYRWYKKVSDIPPLEAGKSYLIKTEATDKAGNSWQSSATTYAATN